MSSSPARRAALVGVPLDLGGNRRGVDMGPSALRMTNLAEKLRQLGYEVQDRGDVDVPLPEEASPGDAKQKYAKEIRGVCEALSEVVYDIRRKGSIPIVLGGDHSIAMGSVAGTARALRDKGESIGVLWIDAHGDMNIPESTNSGNVHGMPLAHIIGLGNPALAGIGGFSPKVLARNTVLIGVRDLDEREKRLIADSKITVITMRQIDRDGIASAMDDALNHVLDGTAGVHVSLDMDVVDPALAPGVGTPKKGGLDYREAHFAMEAIAECGKLLGLDVVEINPILDARNSTAELGAELILSALGKTIF